MALSITASPCESIWNDVLGISVRPPVVLCVEQSLLVLAFGVVDPRVRVSYVLPRMKI